MDYETGETIPALVILRFTRITEARPEWLLSGRFGNYH